MTLIAAEDTKKPDIDTLNPACGDLVWGQRRDRESQVLLHYEDGEYIDSAGIIYFSDEITVLSIIGPCVFAVVV